MKLVLHFLTGLSILVLVLFHQEDPNLQQLKELWNLLKPAKNDRSMNANNEHHILYPIKV